AYFVGDFFQQRSTKLLLFFFVCCRVFGAVVDKFRGTKKTQRSNGSEGGVGDARASDQVLHGAIFGDLLDVVSAYFEPTSIARKREVEVELVEPLPAPVQLGQGTEEELIAYDGSDPKKPLLMAIKGQIYDTYRL
ncbi:membrane steroid-binding protein 1-like, partial [Phalaenopsis equestris]|uniref:membrane steroid-binding protein 1-like n=1 Tax=Phalaenopsis equestris TaxID=78828 RepID=UPI0009E59A1E